MRNKGYNPNLFEMTEECKITPGQTYTCVMPFVRFESSSPGPLTSYNCHPGMRFVNDDFEYGDEYFEADGVGQIELKVLTVCELGDAYMPRIAFVRRYIGPDHQVYSKWKSVEFLTEQSFRKLAMGKRWNYTLPMPF